MRTAYCMLVLNAQSQNGWPSDVLRLAHWGERITTVWYLDPELLIDSAGYKVPYIRVCWNQDTGAFEVWECNAEGHVSALLLSGQLEAPALRIPAVSRDLYIMRDLGYEPASGAITRITPGPKR